MQKDRPNQVLKPRRDGEELKKAEVVLKKKHYDVKDKARRARKLANQRKNLSLKKQLNLGIVTPEKLLKQKRVKILDAKRIHRLKSIRDPPRVRDAGKFPVLFVVRNTRFPVSPAAFSTLKTLGLTYRYTACFLPNTSETLQMLRKVNLFVFYGFLDTDTLRQLLFKKLHFLPSGTSKEMALRSFASADYGVLVSDNTIVEDYLGHHGILCIEDIVDEIRRHGPHFNDVVNIMCPFHLEDLSKAEGLDANTMIYGFIGRRMYDKVKKII